MRTTIWAVFLAIGIVIAGSNDVQGGHFFADFNHGLPKGSKLVGNASIESIGGFKNSGMLQLTDLKGGMTGSFILDPLDGDRPVTSFIASYKAYIGGGTGADGMGFHFGALPTTRIAENSVADEFTVTFDTFKNGPSEVAPAIRVEWHKTILAQVPVPKLRANRFVDVLIKLDPDGTLDVAYDGSLIFSNLYVGMSNLTGRFGLGARTGRHYDYHLVDDLKITTRTDNRAFLDTFAPYGDNASPSPPIEISLKDFGTKVNTNSIRLQLDHKPVSPEIIEAGHGKTLVSYEPDSLLPAGSEHEVVVEFQDLASPAMTNRFTYQFKISSAIIVTK